MDKKYIRPIVLLGSAILLIGSINSATSAQPDTSTVRIGSGKANSGYVASDPDNHDPIYKTGKANPKAINSKRSTTKVPSIKSKSKPKPMTKSKL